MTPPGGARRLERFIRLILLCLWFWPNLSFASCLVRERASVKLEILGTTILVPVAVNGTAGRFVLDTGAALTTVSPAAVARFGLVLDEWTATTMRGIGGIERRRNALPRTVELGGIPLHRRSVARDATLRVATLQGDFDGLLGRDFLSAFDLVIDWPQRHLILYEVRDCSGRFLPWTGAYEAVPVENPAESALIVPVTLDGVSLRALLDSGASQTMIAAPGMARLGLGLDRLAGDPHQVMSGVGQHSVVMWRHRFVTIKIGEEAISGPVFPVAAVRLFPTADLLLGADWFMGRRVWISYATRQIFTTKER